MELFPGLKKSWYVVHTKPKQEERAAKNLEAWRIETFVPRIPSQKKSCPGTEVLFPGYIFVFCDYSALFRKLVFTRGVAHVVCFGGTPAQLSDGLIEEIRGRIAAKTAAAPVAFQKGDPVVIRAGAFRDLIGIFDRETSDHERVQILLNTLAYSVRAELPRSHVSAVIEPVREAV
jgi:transcriptional antiterminator RfaH